MPDHVGLSINVVKSHATTIPARWYATVCFPACSFQYLTLAHTCRHPCRTLLMQAINFWLGSVVMHIWEFFSAAAAAELGSTVGAGLLVGDGLWSIPSSILAIVGKAPPLCMGFYEAGCRLPYCVGFWPGGSRDGPAN